ncbi:probable inactive heme oxygenase 2, chloroplastic isoform X2 [Dendrobium catenatum]|nr:probable inactive heme oxygenase 2, chloroplastic isoform X2 [Dendrobium catenatum]
MLQLLSFFTGGTKMVHCGSFPMPLPFKIPQSAKPYRFCSLSSKKPYYFVCSSSSTSTTSSTISPVGGGGRKRVRNRKLNPGEKEGIVEEMRFVSMRLRTSDANEASATTATWQPSMEGFLNYLVDSKLVFETLERIVEDSTDVTYVYFRRTGLERSASLSKDLKWFKQQGFVIPQPSSPGTVYASYLADLAEKSAPSFLCHFYNIYFAHLYGGCEIGRQVCEKLLLGRKLEFYKWEGDAQKLLKNVRENLNKLGEHWPRIAKNKCLKEAAKSFKLSGQIVRLIILSNNQ